MTEQILSKDQYTVEKEIKIRNILNLDRIIFLETQTKIQSLNELSSVLAQCPQIKDRNELSTSILKREELMSTAIGKGIAIPHVRLSSVTDLVMAVGICKTPLKDFDAMDNQDVSILIMIAAAQNQHSYYLKTISHISSILRQDELRQKIINASTKEEVYKILTAEY